MNWRRGLVAVSLLLVLHEVLPRGKRWINVDELNFAARAEAVRSLADLPAVLASPKGCLPTPADFAIHPRAVCFLHNSRTSCHGAAVVCASTSSLFIFPSYSILYSFPSSSFLSFFFFLSFSSFLLLFSFFFHLSFFLFLFLFLFFFSSFFYFFFPFFFFLLLYLSSFLFFFFFIFFLFFFFFLFLSSFSLFFVQLSSFFYVAILLLAARALFCLFFVVNIRSLVTYSDVDLTLGEHKVRYLFISAAR